MSTERQLPIFAPDSARINGDATDVLFNLEINELGYVLANKPAKPFMSNSWYKPNIVTLFNSESIEASRRRLFGGSQGAIYMYDQKRKYWDDVSQPGTKYAGGGAGSAWSFTQFGDYVIAVNPADKPQRFQLGVDKKFKDLGGNPPKARYVVTWRDFVVLLGLTDSPNTIQWSGLNNAESWTVGKDNSDIQMFPDTGAVVGSSSHIDPIIFTEKATYWGQFNPASMMVFSFSRVKIGLGAVSNRSIVTLQDSVYLASSKGLYRVGVDGSVQNISLGAVENFIAKNITPFDRGDIQTIVDPLNYKIHWCLKLFNAKSRYDTILSFDYIRKNWSHKSLEFDGIVDYFPKGYTLDELDDYNKKLIAIEHPLDSRFWAFGARILVVLTNSLHGNLATLDALAVDNAYFETPLITGANGDIYLIRDVYLEANSRYTVQIGYKFESFEPITWSQPFETSRHAKINMVPVAGRYFKLRFKIIDGGDETVVTSYGYSLEERGKGI